jgi:hypothetical protein
VTDQHPDDQADDIAGEKPEHAAYDFSVHGPPRGKICCATSAYYAGNVGCIIGGFLKPPAAQQ